MLKYYKALTKYLEVSHTDESMAYLLKQRLLEESIVKSMRLGYFNGDINKLIKIVPRDFLLEIGFLYRDKYQSQKYFSPLSKRVIFPIFNVNNEVVGFAGRVIFEDKIKTLKRKYINTKYKKRKILYGLNFSKNYLRKTDTVIIVEGHLDFITGFQNGIKNLVATCGTALTKAHLESLVRYATNIVLLSDSDQAGIESSRRTLKKYQEPYINLYRCFLPGGKKDLDEFLQYYTANSVINVVKKQIDRRYKYEEKAKNARVAHN